MSTNSNEKTKKTCFQSFYVALHPGLLIHPLSKIFANLDGPGGWEIKSLIWIARLGPVNPSQLADLVGASKTSYNRLALGDEKTGKVGFFQKLEEDGMLIIIRKGTSRKEESWIVFSPKYLLLKSILYNLSYKPAFEPKCGKRRLRKIQKDERRLSILLKL